jgi:hypothetical protein
VIVFHIEAVLLGGHVHVHVWTGNETARGKAGNLIMREHEWDAFRAMLDGQPGVEIRYVPADSPLVKLENL